MVIDLDEHILLVHSFEFSKYISRRKADFVSGMITACYVVFDGEAVVVNASVQTRQENTDLIRIIIFFLEVTQICAIFAARILKVITIMARPIRETPVLKGEDAFNFEWRRLMVDHRTPEEKAEARRKFEERIANAKNKIEWCW